MLVQVLGDFNNTGDNRVTEMILATNLMKMLWEEKRTSQAKRKTIYWKIDMIGNLTKSSLIIKEYLETLNKIEKWHDWELNKDFFDN